MNFWNQVPIVRPCIFFILGILSALYLDADVHIPMFVFIALFFVAIIFSSKRIVTYKNIWVYGVIIYLLIFLSGFEITNIKTSKFDSDNFINFKTGDNPVIVQLLEPVTAKPNSYKSVVKVIAVKDKGSWRSTKGKAIVYFKKDSLASELFYGDRIIFNKNFDEIAAPANPYEFNYKKYLSQKGIYNQVYLKQNDWKIISRNNGNKIYAYSFKLKEYLLNILKDNGITGDEFAVVSAMLLGASDYLSPELRAEYSGAGAMHILCVSGLHVGIIFLILNSLLFFLNKNKYARFLKAVILLIFIWFYALLTGLSPSVVRASTMMSFIVVGNTFNRQTNIYNTLAASVFLLLIINPFLITQIGFQLSYMAVIGIVTIYPYLYRLMPPYNWLADKIWSLLCLSFSAQLAIFPIVLFYFNNFPNYFLLTNLIVVPLAGFIIYLGMFVICISFINFLNIFFSKILCFVISFLNHSIFYINDLPYSQINNVNINFFELLVIYLIIFSLCFYFIEKRPLILKLGLSFFIILLSSIAYNHYNVVNTRKIIVYNINKHTAIDFFDKDKSLFFCDSAIINDDKNLEYKISGNRIKNGIKNIEKYNLDEDSLNMETYDFFKEKNFIQFYDKRICIIDDDNNFFSGNKKIKIDYLIIRNNKKLNVADLLLNFSPALIIIDSSVSKYYSRKIKEECKNSGIAYYSVSESGAYVSECL